MMIKDFDNISMNGRMAYAILCIEKYVLEKFPDEDWTVLAKEMWKATSMNWDEWDNRWIEIIPTYLFEEESFEASDFEEITEDDYNAFSTLLKDKPEELDMLMQKLHELANVYAYSSIPENGEEASQILLDISTCLKKESILLPDVEKVRFSSFSEKNGWGNDFDGRILSMILV